MKRVVTMGGGGGHAALLEVLRDFPFELTALCNTVDDGGGSGQLMRDYGVHHPGEVRRVLAALAGKKGAELDHRFPDGPLKGQTLGNVMLAGLERVHGSFGQAIEKLRSWYGIRAAVMPITSENPTLHAKMQSGKEVIGQANVVRQVWATPKDGVERLWVEPADMPLSPKAAEALKTADYIIVAMGDLYSSIAPSFCLSELQQLWGTIRAKVIWFPNVVAPLGHTHYQTASQALAFMQSLCPAFHPDWIVAHAGGLDETLQATVTERGYMISAFDIPPTAAQVLLRPLLDAVVVEKKAGDQVERSPVHYHQEALIDVFKELII